eukprot:920260-Pyramimonas_sp.AAC.1
MESLGLELPRIIQSGFPEPWPVPLSMVSQASRRRSHYHPFPFKLELFARVGRSVASEVCELLEQLPQWTLEHNA